MIDPTNIINTSGTGTATNCLSTKCWSIRVSNPQVTGIPSDATITGARFTIIGTGIEGFLQVLIGKNSTYCLSSIFVGDKFSAPRDSNDVLTGGNVFFSNCKTADGFPSSVSELSNFFLELTAPKSFTPAGPFTFINPQVAFDYTLPVTPTLTSTLTQTPTPTITPSLTQTPTPTPPEPFLDLPYDYQSKGKSFKDVAFDPMSWFDHQYPLQNFCCAPPVLNYTGELKNDFYRSHSGYDYASDNGVVLNTPVLAAASGLATFKYASQSAGAGNIIKIDHGNGYQTWYEHLSSDGLVVSVPGVTKHVDKGQQIGKVGMTGNTTGPHIHLSVFKDANGNDTFDDDYPWGLVDPLGWEGDSPDPWTEWESGGRKGTRSYNLFTARAPPKEEVIPPIGGKITLEDIIIDILNGTFDEEIKIVAEHGPFEAANTLVKSVAPSLFLNAVDSLGQEITQLLQPATITYDYADSDLLNIKEDTLKIYWFNELTGEWEPLPSFVDTINKRVFSQTNHFSQFALMGEVKDLVAPTTEIILTGAKGQEAYRSDVVVELNGFDNEGGVGLQYTLYTLNGSDWFEYTNPITFSTEGLYSITYQSFDKADNKEERKTFEVRIDKTPPEAQIYYVLQTKEIQIEGKDGTMSAQVAQSSMGGGSKKIVVMDKAGNTLTIIAKSFSSKLLSLMSFQTLQYNTNPPIIFDKNSFVVTSLYNLKTGKLSSIGEIYAVKDKNLIGIFYNLVTDKTKIYMYDKQNKELLKEEKSGTHLLQLRTESGSLKYSY